MDSRLELSHRRAVARRLQLSDFNEGKAKGGKGKAVVRSGFRRSPRERAQIMLRIIILVRFLHVAYLFTHHHKYPILHSFNHALI